MWKVEVADTRVHWYYNLNNVRIVLHLLGIWRTHLFIFFQVQAAILCDLASITTKGTAKSSATDFSTRLEKDKIFPMKDTYRTLLVSKVSSLAKNCIGRARIFYCILSVPNYQHLYSNSKSQDGDGFASRIDSVVSSLKGVYHSNALFCLSSYLLQD